MTNGTPVAALAAAIGATAMSDEWNVIKIRITDEYEPTPTAREGARAYREAKAEREAREAREAKASQAAQSAAEAKRAKRKARNRRAAGLPEPPPYPCESCGTWPECREGGCAGTRHA